MAQQVMTDKKYMRAGLNFAVGKAVEELGELQAALGKTLRWGWNSVNPELPPSEQETNLDWVCREIADVRGALNNLRQELWKKFNLPSVASADDPWEPPTAADLATTRRLQEEKAELVEALRKIIGAWDNLPEPTPGTAIREAQALIAKHELHKGE